MKYSIALAAVIACVGSQGLAQGNGLMYESGPESIAPVLPNKRNVVRYDEATNTVVEVEPPQQAVETGRNPIYILNNQHQKYSGHQGVSQRVIQEQPITVVEASPLTESQSERLRRARQSMEAKTEQKIVEKLEEARIEDERARADRLFGNRFGGGHADSEAQIPALSPVPAPIPVVVTSPAPVQAATVTPAVPLEDEIDNEYGRLRKDSSGELRTSLDAYGDEASDRSTYFISGQVGLTEYPDADNVKGNVSTGISIGVVTDQRVIVEGTFLYSDYQALDYSSSSGSPFKDLSQYNFIAALKYQLLPGKLRPYAGGLLGYTYRKAIDQYGGYSGSVYQDSEGTSNSFDVGLTAGLDLQLTPSFAIGADFRYLTNVSYRRNGQFSYWQQNFNTEPIEESDYYIVTLNGKFTF